LDIVGAAEGQLLDLQHPPGHHVSGLLAPDGAQRFDHLFILRPTNAYHNIFIKHMF